jgi:hypothetical protein
MFILSGTCIVDDDALAWIELPIFTVAGEGIVGIADGTANISIPLYALSGAGILNPVGTAEISCPLLTLSATDTLSVTSSVEIEIPMFTMDATAVRGATGTFDQEIPLFTVDTTGHLSAEGTASITLPIISLSVSFTPQSYLNMVLNLRNAALTLYTNYDFNSFCRFNGKHFGATKTGIYDLDTGTLDDTTEMEWNFRIGYLDLDQRVSKKLRQAWLSYKSSGDIIVTAITPEGDEYEYTLGGIEDDETGLRVKFGKGLKSKYVAIDVKNVDGSSIVLDVLRLIMDKTGRMR